jgi:hypothetical protein
MGRGEPIRSFEFERLEVPGVELLLGGQSIDQDCGRNETFHRRGTWSS